MYSPPIMTRMAGKLGMILGLAMDLTTADDSGSHWDFSHSHMREKALKLQDDVKPRRLILSPPYTMFSTMQNGSMCKMSVEDALMHFGVCGYVNEAGTKRPMYA